MPYEYAGRWRGETVVCMASGPSMTRADAEYCHGKARVITVNSTFRLAPWADAVYTNDHDWLQMHLNELRMSFDGEIWCGHQGFKESLWVHHVPFDKGCQGLSTKPRHIAWGMNSGAAALDLARWFGATRIVMLGYDQQWKGDTARWHGLHPEGLQNRRPGFHRWARWFQQAALDFERLGIPVVNCSRETSLTCFRRVPLEEALCSRR